MTVILLSCLVGAYWIPVVWIQLRICDRLNRGADIDECRSHMRLWIALGVPAFTSVLVPFWLMIFKPGTGRLVFVS